MTPDPAAKPRWFALPLLLLGLLGFVSAWVLYFGF